MNVARRFGTPGQRAGYTNPCPDQRGLPSDVSMLGYIYVVDAPEIAKIRKYASARRNGPPLIEDRLRMGHPRLTFAADIFADNLEYDANETALIRPELCPKQILSPAIQ